ncbi:MAG: xylulokinase [Spirochaetales bacterium]|uniref:Xylulose kinase n=1 Tax=Candidatus Thalassospirochaeta sargassi TaxID=3119039 RepID=A0AAJ1IFB7_9SPIO|nr:xylulokinase [Spirochaetales bacterium]
MNTVLGIDMGTQSVKFLVYDYETKTTVATVQQKLNIITDADGTSEQKAEWWIEAAKKCADEISSDIKKTVRAVGVSGQQHGFVPVDAEGSPLYNAKLWNDVSTTAECAEITERFGGEEKLIAEVGNKVLPGYTAPKVLWLKKHKPEIYSKLAHILLPHDYMNFFLTGEYTAEYGDASGTAFFDVRKRCWSESVLRAIDPERDLLSCLPRLKAADDLAGFVTTEAAYYFGIPEGTPVSTGGGDNMMGAVGTGAVREGVLTMSLGTSGTIYVYGDTPLIDPEGNLAAFCSSTGGWLPLLCTMNCTVATEQMRALFDMPLDELNSKATAVPPGADGIIVLPYFGGERTPSMPNGRAVIAGMNMNNVSEAGILRASMESAVFGLKLGFESLASLGVKTNEVRLIGGGAKSALWRKITADVLDAKVVTLAEEEAAALGAALQALWALKTSEDGYTDLTAITDEHIKLNEEETVLPGPEAVKIYEDVYAEYKEYLELLKPKFL